MMSGNKSPSPPPFLAARPADQALSSFRYGRSLLEKGRIEEASTHFRKAFDIDPSMTEALAYMGKACEMSGHLEKAEELYKQVLAARPDMEEIVFALGNLFLNQGRLEESELIYRYGLSMKPGSPAMHNNLANVLKARGDLGKAEDHYRQAISIDPAFAVSLYNLGTMLLKQGRFHEAQRHLDRCVDLKPDFAPAIDNLGNTFMELGEYGSAEKCYRKALAAAPDSHDAAFDLSYLLLLHGNYDEGLKLYEKRLEKAEFSYLRATRQQKDPGISGRTILVRCEQGLGDTLQFVRFLPLLKERGGRVIFESQPQLAELLSLSQGADGIVPRKADLSVPHVPHDRSEPLMSLPHILGTTVDSIPARVPYIFIDNNKKKKWMEKTAVHRAGKFMLVGIAWSGNKRYAGDTARSVTFSDLLPLLSMSGIRFYSLQYGEAVKEAERLFPENLSIVTEDIKDFTETAGLICNLDLVITVDSVIAHLAGALGAQVWNLLPYVPDWRWLLEREDSPWYPTMRLFRQRSLNDWPETVERVRIALTELRNTLI
ncbi:MAG TPA: tetratricopeptide repeat-containing glycosyltransferase family protein [Syntrophorhabdaceae bacterium]|nr:tetratricopeptide repeat-containing glycosyltransferase family protein [Syntrophorhabdaceae bacterium]